MWEASRNKLAPSKTEGTIAVVGGCSQRHLVGKGRP